MVLSHTLGNMAQRLNGMSDCVCKHNMQGGHYIKSYIIPYVTFYSRETQSLEFHNFLKES